MGTMVQSSPLPSGERAWVRGEGLSARAETSHPLPGAEAPTSPLRGEVNQWLRGETTP